jgi:tRNA-specific 2-thiouridylase
VVVGERDEALCREAVLDEVVWSGADPGDSPLRVEAKVRYNMAPRPALLTDEGTTRLLFDEPVHAVTPGQSAAAYVGETVVAGGVIR